MVDSSTPPNTADASVRRIGHFDVLKIGRYTPWGESYVVRDGTRTGRLNICAHWLSQDPSFRASFEQMAPSLVKLDHPNLGRNYEFGLIDGRLYSMEEEFSASSIREISHILDASISVSPISVRRAAIDLCSALHAVHQVTYPNGDPVHLLYRVPLPGRIFFTEEGSIKLGAPVPWPAIWLNLNRYRVEDRETLFFRAPEELHGAPATIHHDLYALARCLLIMLRPAPQHTPIKRAEKYVRESLQELEQTYPKFAAVLHRALADDPDARFQCAEDMMHALEPLNDAELEQSNAEIRQFLTESRARPTKNPQDLAQSVQKISKVQQPLRRKSGPDQASEVLRRRAYTVDIPIARAPKRSDVRRQPLSQKHTTPHTLPQNDSGAFDAPPPISKRPPQRTPTPPSLPSVPPQDHTRPKK